MNPPDVVRAAGKTYREEQDRVGQFLNEQCERRDGAKAPLSVLYARYKEWARDSGFGSLGKNKFSVAVGKQPGITAAEDHYTDNFGKRRSGTVFTGLVVYP